MAAHRGTEYNQTPNPGKGQPGSQTVGDKFHGQKGNSPDRRLRSLNSC